jgi:chaperonin GroES
MIASDILLGKEFKMIIPIRDFIVVSKEDATQTTSSGLYIAHAEEKNIKGTVLATGSGRVTMNGSVVPLDVSKGDTVLFNKNSAIEVKDGEKVVFVLREDNVICILR